ncbi:MAG: ATP-binding protein, partial [Akkermansia sp.]|nr:ATP-binding protein [Akkermansia sp.]
LTFALPFSNLCDMSDFVQTEGYLKRKIDAFLDAWKADIGHKPLIVRGARQVGKTEAIMQFALRQYENVVYVNFVESPHYKGINEEGYAVGDIVRILSRMNPDFRFEKGNTLIFFDEVQEFPEITTALKFFHIDGRFDVICSGSLLGVQYSRIESHSVGYKQDYEMRSFDFEEYLWARGYQDDVVEDMLAHLLHEAPFSNAELERYFSLFLDYVILGGMPAVIREFVQSGTFEAVSDIQKQLLRDYREDIRKYASGLDKAKILAVFNHVPPQLAKENKKFQMTKIAKNARSRDYLGCVEGLLDSGLLSICYCLHNPELPLKGNYDLSKYKLYVADTGLLLAMLDEESRDDLLRNKNLGIYKGALYENFVAEALSKSGYELFYYRKDDSTLEMDFFVRTADDLIPVEVKAGNTVSKSLRKLVESDKYGAIHTGIKLARANIGRSDAFLTIPYFCAFLLRRYLKAKTEI